MNPRDGKGEGGEQRWGINSSPPSNLTSSEPQGGGRREGSLSISENPLPGRPQQYKSSSSWCHTQEPELLQELTHFYGKGADGKAGLLSCRGLREMTQIAGIFQGCVRDASPGSAFLTPAKSPSLFLLGDWMKKFNRLHRATHFPPFLPKYWCNFFLLQNAERERQRGGG